MKKIIVFGAAGRTGKYVVQYALDAGYAVTAFVHSHKCGLQHPNLKEITGDVLNHGLVLESIKGHDAVVSTLGAHSIEGDAVNLMSDAMKIFVEAMAKYQIKRVLAVGGLAVLQWNETMQMLDKPDYPAEYKNIGEGHNKVYKVLRETDLGWTFICCPDIIDGPKDGNYNLKKDYPAEGKFGIYTGNIADFIVSNIEGSSYLRTRVGIANKK